jgi:hypothetical protein
MLEAEIGRLILQPPEPMALSTKARAPPSEASRRDCFSVWLCTIPADVPSRLRRLERG